MLITGSLTEFNLSGLDDGNNEDPLAKCLAEFPQITETSNPHGPKKSTSSLTKNETDNPMSDSSCLSPEMWEKQNIDIDRVESWNLSFLSWQNTGNYPPGLLPSIDEELARHFHVLELSTFLLRQSRNIRMPSFERWLMDTRLDDTSSSDPVLPVSAHATSPSSRRLFQELCQHNIDRDKAEQTVVDLCRMANVAGRELASQFDRYRRTSPLKKGDRIDIEDHETTVTFIYVRKKWKKPFCFPLNKTHLGLLEGRFFGLHNKAITCKLDSRSSQVRRGFNIVVLALLLRYSSLSGGQLLQDLRGGGMQGAIHEQVFEILRETWKGPWVEGYASPFNCYLPVFCSAFCDIDWHFGSSGSFLRTSFVRDTGCCCEANPPFSPRVMSAMVDHMENQLAEADRKKTPLTFVVVVPTATATSRAVQEAAKESFQRMLINAHCRMHIQLEARQHGYVEGAQHLRPTRYKQSTYDTSVILLQSKRDLEKALNERELEAKIRGAFASRHDEEGKIRRGEKSLA